MGLDQFAYRTNHRIQQPVDFRIPEGTEPTEIHYWRKHPNLQGWMEQLYYAKGGEAESFNCVPVELTASDLDLLEKAIKEGDLPHTSGFFFGQSSGDEEESNDDLNFIKEARKAIAEGDQVYYDSWW